MSPKRVGAYRLVHPIGSGAMGTVYEAVDERSGAKVALKLLGLAAREQPGRTARFLREGRAATSIDHPNVARAFDVGDTGEFLWLAMELVRGRPLREHLRDGPYPVSETLRVGLPLTRGVGAAHAVGVLHRDLKPENIILTRDGGLKILDFGLAKRPQAMVDEMGPTSAGTSANITGKSVVVGSPGYMSPEQIRTQELDAGSDIFTIGILLYEVLTGGVPFHGDTPIMAMIATYSDTPMPPRERRPDCPPLLDAVILRCLEKDPEDRYRSCAALEADLERARAEL